MIDYRGARGSNTGDDFHELWATRQAIRLLDGEEDLQALTVEGVPDPSGSFDAWDGVDCTLCFGGSNAATAKQVRIEQLKYSGSSPDAPWTVARLVQGKPGKAGRRRGASVIEQLAKAWRTMCDLRPGAPSPAVALVTNQPVSPELTEAVRRAAAKALVVPRRQPGPDAAGEVKLAYASGLEPGMFRAFAASLDLVSSTGSRFALEDRTLQAVAAWTDQDARLLVLTLRQFVHSKMLPENAGALITREAVLLHALGASDKHALFPCPPDVHRTEQVVQRAGVEEAAQLLRAQQHLCLHGEGGVGKTTALQQIERSLPPGSVMVTFDCYGGGRYLDPAALRHKQADAFVQIANEVATKLRLPLLLSRQGTQQGATDFPRLFMHRLQQAAGTLASANPDALLVIAIDAADNSVAAARERQPAEVSFVHDFVRLGGLPPNVRFVVTVRTGRVGDLGLPEHFQHVPLQAFSREETGRNVRLRWDASEVWVDDFHRLSGGTPRVQSYAFDGVTSIAEQALDRLRPGKSLADVFEERFREALVKNGSRQQVASLCAGLVALARPVPLAALASVLGWSEPQVRDTCSDLAPGIRLENGAASFADEDFEAFVRDRAGPELPRVKGVAADWLLSHARCNSYAALNVAPALAGAERLGELLTLVEQEPSPAIIADPIQRREAEMQRLRLALSASSAAGEPSRALRYVLLGAEGIRTDDALWRLLADNPDLAARFASGTVGRLFLSNPGQRRNHGRLLFHQLVIHAERRDGSSYREGKRLLSAWLDARKAVPVEVDGQPKQRWPVDAAAICAETEAAFKLEGPAAALRHLDRWRPRAVQLEAALALPARLIAEGKADELEALLATGGLGPTARLFVTVPLALAGRTVDPGLLEVGLTRLSRRVGMRLFFDGHQSEDTLHTRLVDLLLTGCEVLTARDPSRAGVDAILDRILMPEQRRIDRLHTFAHLKLDAIFRIHALREARAGRIPASAGVFVPRPTPKRTAAGRPQQDNSADHHDRELRDFADTVFPLYAAVACALTRRRAGEPGSDDLQRCAGSFSNNGWRFRRESDLSNMRACAARHLLVLLATDYDPALLTELALSADDRWCKGYWVPDEGLVARVALREETHEPLLGALSGAASATFKMRMGAQAKADTLVRYARFMAPMSPEDAGQVFRMAVDAAGELDSEGRVQLAMLGNLVIHASEALLDRRQIAGDLVEIVADAAVRLDQDRHFPWQGNMTALAQLDVPLALAAAARWDVQGLVSLRETLPSTLQASLNTGALSPGQAAAAALILEQDAEVLSASLARAESMCDPNLVVLRQEAAKDALLRPGRGGMLPDMARMMPQGEGCWTDAVVAQEQFKRALPSSKPQPARGRALHDEKGLPAGCKWTRDAAVDGAALATMSHKMRDVAREAQNYLSLREVLSASRSVVPIRDRALHLDALAWMVDHEDEDEAAWALTAALEAWPNPAVDAWCAVRLPEFIEAWLPLLAQGLPHGSDRLSPLLERSGLTRDSKTDLLLRAAQRHVNALTPEVIFALTAYIGRLLSSAGAAGVLIWYVTRLVHRVPPEHRERIGPADTLPLTAEEAVARLFLAQMGSPDTRVRWRAAHGVRRLALTGEQGSVAAFVAQYGRQEELAFAGPAPAYYPIAARQWAVITLDRIAAECPHAVLAGGRLLLQAALDDAFPHLLVRAFARDACRKLITAGVLAVSPVERDGLKQGAMSEPG